MVTETSTSTNTGTSRKMSNSKSRSRSNSITANASMAHSESLSVGAGATGQQEPPNADEGQPMASSSRVPDGDAHRAVSTSSSKAKSRSVPASPNVATGAFDSHASSTINVKPKSPYTTTHPALTSESNVDSSAASSSSEVPSQSIPLSSQTQSYPQQPQSTLPQQPQPYSSSFNQHHNGYENFRYNQSHYHTGSGTGMHPHHTGGSNPRLPRPSETFTRELSNVLQHSFLPSVLPTAEEYQIKESLRKFLESLAEKVTPGAKLLPFGSQANGMALRNSDMDLCYISGPGQPARPPSELVELLGKTIEQEAPNQFIVKCLPRARIPIIKLTYLPNQTTGNTQGISCDIGFENRLALENTRLLLTYAMADPRLRTLVLFLKVWAKRRKINSPYMGTLSSYGYVLLVIHFLINVKKPGVLPNLQRLQPPKTTTIQTVEFEGRDIYFFDDLELLPQVWTSNNRDSVGELLISFFHYYHKEFKYTFDCISIRSEGGVVSKASKGWMSDQTIELAAGSVSSATAAAKVSAAKDQDAKNTSGTSTVPTSPVAPVIANVPRDLNRLCIEDPFQTDYNVARTVTVDGLFTIRGEIARATSILRGTRSEAHVNNLIAELVEEREDFLVQAPPPGHYSGYHSSASNRRRSAPSPRLQPTVLATHNDFRAWAMANGVPHAQGLHNAISMATSLPNGQSGHVYSHHLQPNPLQEEGSNSTTQTASGGQAANSQTSPNNDAMGRNQQASHILTQANLQQQQQQQLLANLPAFLRNFRGPPRRFHEHSYRNRSYNPNHFQQQQFQQSMQNQHSINSLGSPPMGSTSHTLHPHASGPGQPRNGNPTSQNFPGSLGAAPTLDRRSSWDGSGAGNDLRTEYRRSSSVSEAGGEITTTTAPTSPTMHGGNLPAFSRGHMYNQKYTNLDRPPREQRNYTSSNYRSNSHHTSSYSSSGNYRGRPIRTHRPDQEGAGLGFAQLSPQTFPVSPLPLPLAHVPLPPPLAPLPAQYGIPTNSGHSFDPSMYEALSFSEGARSPSVKEEDELVDAGSVQFGNFDAALYSSEPSEMAGLGDFDDLPTTDSSNTSGSASAASGFDDLMADETSTPAAQTTSAKSSVMSTGGARGNVLRYKPQLADIPASPAGVARKASCIPSASTTTSPTSTQRPAMHSRRRSAGDEADLVPEDVTFFGKIPAIQDEGEREKAVISVTKDTKDGLPYALPKRPAPVRQSSSNTNAITESKARSSNPSATSASLSTTSSSTSITSVSTSASVAESIPVKEALDVPSRSAATSATPTPPTTDLPPVEEKPQLEAAESTSSKLTVTKADEKGSKKKSSSSTPKGTLSPATSLNGKPRRKVGN